MFIVHRESLAPHQSLNISTIELWCSCLLVESWSYGARHKVGRERAAILLKRLEHSASEQSNEYETWGLQLGQAQNARSTRVTLHFRT
jgi:hypothetical protein